jgi:diguanylate cyclase (GGDEF)-like protein
MTLRIGDDPPLGSLALGHATLRARGFTSLCQRIGRAIADAAELLISQAQTRERLAAERDELARATETDELTGVGNLRRWESAAAAVRRLKPSEPAYVISCDIDQLKLANDSYGHAAGDALIRGAANLLTSCVRADDVVARVGGDEFLVLLHNADASSARRVAARIRRAERVWRVTEHRLTPCMSLGLAPVPDGDVREARRWADARLYENKRRRKIVRSRPAATGATVAST